MNDQQLAKKLYSLHYTRMMQGVRAHLPFEKQLQRIQSGWIEYAKQVRKLFEE